MPTARYSSFDRGFDLGHADVPLDRTPVLDRKISSGMPQGAPWKKVLAMAMVAIMVATAFVMLAPVAKPPASAPVEETPAHTQAPGAREVTYTISNIGESYLKDSRDVDGARGNHGSTPGLSEWWFKRKAAYSDTVVHNSTPYSIAYNPESSLNNYNGVTHLSFGTYSFFRLTIDAKNITTVATGPNKDPLFLPVLGSLASDGGTVRLNWHFTYLTSSDVTAMLAGTSYVNTYYGVTPSALSPLGNPSYANDGWYYEHSGTMSLDRAAAQKILGLPGSADLRTDFTTANTAGALNNSFRLHYWNEGSPDQIYDTKASYDYSINTGPSNCYFLKLDPSSTPDLLVVRVWGYTWGMDALMISRYMEVAGLDVNFQGWPEDWYFNATISSNGADIYNRMTVAYHMTTWKDSTWWGPCYELGAQHDDYNDYDGPYWLSRFTPYMAYRGYTPLKTQWEPGTNNIGANVAFWVTPRLWNLATGEKLILKLPTQAMMGYIPYKGSVSDVFPKNGGGNDAKAAELNTHQMWGEMVLGPGTFPSTLYSTTYYDAGNKTLTMVGPTSLPRNPDSVFANLNETGSPSFMLDISKVSHYELSVVGGTPSAPGTYTLTVTAKNITGAVVTDWNGTVNLVATGPATFGQNSHTFVPSDAGVWSTTLTITGYGSVVITSKDSLFYLDVFDTLSINSIPEFPTLLIPVMAAAAMIVVFIRRRDKKKSS